MDELAFNAAVASLSSAGSVGCKFYDQQFRRAIEHGAIAVIKPNLQIAILHAYVAIGRANTLMETLVGSQEGLRSYSGSSPTSRAAQAITDALPGIMEAQQMLLRFLRQEDTAPST